MAAAATGAYALGASDDTARTEVLSPDCSIMFADGNPYWDEFSKTQLVEADKQVRRLPSGRGWLIVLNVDSQRDRLVGRDYDLTRATCLSLNPPRGWVACWGRDSGNALLVGSMGIAKSPYCRPGRASPRCNCAIPQPRCLRCSMSRI